MASDASSPEDPSPERGTIRERLRGWLLAIRAAPAMLRRHLLVTWLVGAGVLFVVTLAAAGWWKLDEMARERRSLTLAAALTKLDAGDYQEARRIASQLRYGDRLEYEELGGPVYVLGAAMAHEAAVHWDPDQKEPLYLIAARYLEEARDRGFPPGREADGLYLLGECLYRAERYAESLPVLREALEKNPRRRVALYRFISEAYLRDADPQPDKALQFHLRYASDASLTPDQRYEAMLERSRILDRLGNLPGAREALASIPDTAKIHSEALLMQGWLLIREGDQLLADSAEAAAGDPRAAASAKYLAAIQQLRGAQAHDRAANQSTQKAAYLLGVCHRKLGDKDAATRQFHETQRLYVNTPESLAASLEEADVLREMQNDLAAVGAYRRSIQEAGDPAAYSNPWISLGEFRDRLLGAYGEFCRGGRFDSAVDLAKAMRPLFPQARCVRLQAEAFEKSGESLEQEAVGAPAPEAAILRARSRSQFRAAAFQYERLAKLWLARREYPDALWQSGADYLRGRNYERTLLLLQRYLDCETRRRRPETLAMIGRARLALGEPDAALEPLLECIQLHPKHPDSYRARLTASQAYVEKGELPKAKQLLTDNLYDEALTPRSAEWRDSLFQLGRILHNEGVHWGAQSLLSRRTGGRDAIRTSLQQLQEAYAKHQEAVSVLSEAVQRYPDAPQTAEAMYWIADSRRRSTEWPRTRRDLAEIETMRAELTGRIREESKAALAAYDELLELLQRRIDERALSEVEQRILRNCYFGRADIQFEVERYEDAIATYSEATDRFSDRPEALEAYVQIARCRRQLGRRDEARDALEQAKVVLRRIPEDADFSKTTRYGRDEWTRLLDLLCTL